MGIWRIKAAVGLALTGLVLLGGADIAKQAVHGHGHWHQLAVGLYHAVKGQAASAAALPAERADGPLVVYTDALGDGWQDWSWGTRSMQAAGNNPFRQVCDFAFSRRQPGRVPAP